MIEKHPAAPLTAGVKPSTWLPPGGCRADTLNKKEEPKKSRTENTKKNLTKIFKKNGALNKGIKQNSKNTNKHVKSVFFKEKIASSGRRAVRWGVGLSRRRAVAPSVGGWGCRACVPSRRQAIGPSGCRAVKLSARPAVEPSIP